jgi:hypothetical protein
MKREGDFTGIPQKDRVEREKQQDLETLNFRVLFDSLLAEGNDKNRIINYLIKKDSEIVQSVVENWLNGMHIPSDRVLRNRIISALEKYQAENRQVAKDVPSPALGMMEALPKKPRKSRLHSRIQANENQLETMRRRAEENRVEKARIKSNEAYDALMKKLKDEGKIT